MNESTNVEEDGFIEPENDEIDHLLDQFIEDCRNNTFQTLNIDVCMILNLEI